MPAPYAVNSTEVAAANALLVEANAEIVVLKAERDAKAARISELLESTKPLVGDIRRVM
jgi:hypothetical protein